MWGGRQCSKLAHVRLAHEEALTILRDTRPDWVYIPLAHSHEDLTLQRAFIHTLPKTWELNHFDAETRVTFYTDGGAINPILIVTPDWPVGPLSRVSVRRAYKWFLRP